MPGNSQTQPRLNGGARCVLVSFAVIAAMFVVECYSDLLNDAAFFVALLATGPCGGGSVAAIRGGGQLSVWIGTAGAAWVLVAICFFACQALGITHL